MFLFLSFISKPKKVQNPPKETKKESTDTLPPAKTPIVDKPKAEPKKVDESQPVVDERQVESNFKEPEFKPADDIKVERVPSGLPLKHPLNSKWTLWYYYPEKPKEWEDCQHRIHTVETVEDFWSIFNHLKYPSELTSGVDYSFFKNGIRPMWEDQQNYSGGRLTIISAAKARHAIIDEIWLDLLLFLIGEKCQQSDNVCGTVLNTRQYGFKVAVWTSIQERKEVTEIGQSIKNSLTTPLLQPITFEPHDETKKKANYGKSKTFMI